MVPVSGFRAFCFEVCPANEITDELFQWQKSFSVHLLHYKGQAMFNCLCKGSEGHGLKRTPHAWVVKGDLNCGEVSLERYS